MSFILNLLLKVSFAFYKIFSSGAISKMSVTLTTMTIYRCPLLYIVYMHRLSSVSFLILDVGICPTLCSKFVVPFSNSIRILVALMI